jgi:hypothetical protein
MAEEAKLFSPPSYMDCKLKSSQLLKEVSIPKSVVRKKIGPQFVHISNLV